MSRLVLPIVVALGLVLVGCGGADGGDEGSVASRGETVDAAGSGAESAALATAPSEANEEPAVAARQAESSAAEAAAPATAPSETNEEPAVAARQADSESDSEPAGDRLSTVANDASPPSVVPGRPGGASGFTHFVFERIGDRVVTTLVEGPRGGQVREAVSFLQLQELAGSDADVPAELQMTREELGTLVDQLRAVRAGVSRYEDVARALEDGYVQSTDVVPNMGAHFTHAARIVDGELNFAEPEILIYAENELGGWELVGTSFVLPYQLVGEDHPDGFAGPLDNWHMHYSLCTGTAINSRAASAVDCARDGGTFVPAYGWMIHAWVVDDNPMGVFSMWNPNVPPTLTAEIRQARDSSIASEHLHLDGSVHQHGVPLEIPDGAVVVNIENFHHSTLEIEEGQTVIWVNTDGVPHTITAGRSGAANGGFDSLLIGAGQTYSHRFGMAGEFEFTCTVHPQMNGTIIVVPKSA